MAWRLTCLALALVAVGTSASAEDPKITPGRDPGGVAVAVLADGFDTTRADVLRILARDGEGEAIAWDAVDGDHRPFVREGAGTEVALAAAAKGGVRIVPVRVAMGDAASLAKGVTFAQSTPARLLLVELADRERLDVMTAAAARFPAILFVVSLPGVTTDAATASEAVANLVLIDSKNSPHAAASAVAQALGCARGDLAGATGAELKHAFLDRLNAQSSAACDPERGEPK